MDGFPLPVEDPEMESPPGKDPIPDPPSPNHNVGQVGEPSAGGADRADARGSGKRPLDRAEGVTRFEPCAQRNFGVFLSDRGDAHGSQERPVDCWELLGKRRDHADALGSGSGKSRGEDVLGLVGAAHGNGEPPVDSAIVPVPVPAPDARGSGKRPLDRAALITRLDLNPLRNRTKACSQRNLDLFLSDDELSSVLGSDSGSDSSSSSALDNEEAPAMVPAPAPVPVPIPAPERSVSKRSRFQFTSAAPDIPADAPRARRVVGAINDGKGSVMPVYAEDEVDDDKFDRLWDSFEFDVEAEPDSTLPPISTWPKTPDTSRRGPLTNWDVEVFLFSMFADGFKLNMEVIREVLGRCGYDIKKSMEELISFSAKDLGPVNEHIAVQDMAAESSFSRGSCVGSQSTSSAHSLREDKHDPRPQITPGELLASMFTVPERSEEEPEGRQYELVTNQRRFPDQKPALKALEDISPSSTDLPVKIIPCSKEPVVRDEDDYQNYLMDAKQHWDVMKQYYEKAVDAFKEGDKNYELYILQGKHYHKMARLSEEKYYAEITRSNKSSKTSAGSYYWLSR